MAHDLQCLWLISLLAIVLHLDAIMAFDTQIDFFIIVYAIQPTSCLLDVDADSIVGVSSVFCQIFEEWRLMECKLDP